jgi:hypothetical protein
MMKRVFVVLLTLLASVSLAEARQKKAVACTVHVEIVHAVDSAGKDYAAIDQVWTKGKTKCESTGKVKFLLNNDSDIPVTVFVKNFQKRAGGVCTGSPSGTNIDAPVEGSVRQIRLSADAQDTDKETDRIIDLGTTGKDCYKFDVYLYKKKNTNSHIDFLDPDLELGPPSGPPPPKGGQ